MSILFILSIGFVFSDINNSQLDTIVKHRSIGLKQTLTDENFNYFSTNTNIINDLHFILMENPSFLKFHDTKEEDIKECGLEVKEFVYILNSLLVSEFYYDSFSSAKSIVDDLSYYRMKFLNHPEVEAAWNKIIRKHWTMAPYFVQAINEFYLNRETYINRDQGTAV